MDYLHKKHQEYVEEHHLGPSKHTTLRNLLVYFRKMKVGSLDTEKAKEL